MPVVVVTVTLPAGTVTATPTTSANSSSLSAGTVAGIIIGTLIGGVLFITLVLYLLNRYHRRKFARVANPAHDGAPHLRHPSTNSNLFTRRSQRPSISSEPLMSPSSWPPLPTTSRVLSQGTPPVLPGIEDGQYSSFDLGEIDHVIASVSRSTTPARQASGSSPPGSVNTPPQSRQASGDGASSPPTPTQSHQTLFLHRILKSRAQASEGVSLARSPSLGFSQSRSTTLDSSDVHGDEERLLAEAERTALRDAETDQREEVVEEMVEGEVGLEEVESTESNYSQVSAPMDYFSEPVPRQNDSLSVPRRKSSRKQARAPAPSNELSPVTEMPDTPRALEGQTVSRPASAAVASSLDVQVSHGAPSCPMSSVVDQSFPLLTSANFGKDSTTSGTSAGSISTAGWGSNSSGSGRTSRYPSLAPSSILQSSRSGPHSDAGTDWHHTPSGLAGLSSLQIGPMHNPHSPAEERPERRDMLRADPVPVKRAHLREGTASSIPEVERRDVMQGGIAHIDVTL
ncbi:hypothetical protein OG21DRAFT_1021377 [Imleria badia]|nr:hypothetical protein OG21DRAFT_1021377 [Imleria badia]